MEKELADGPTEPPELAADYVAEADTGARNPTGLPAKALWTIPFLWTLFQIWIASPLPYILRVGVFNSTEVRSIHLAFAIFLAFTAFPALKRSPRDRIPLKDWVLGLLAALCAAYGFMFQNELADRMGNPTTLDITVGVVGISLLLEATRRALGPPLMVVATVFMTYAFFGPYMPEVIAHQGASLAKGMSHYWITTEGVFGIAVGVSSSMVFLFVLFGSLLERAGAGNYFIRVAFSLLGHMRGGPAKAAVVSSGMTGLVSGSSIANVVTTGTFTIPLMKRVGFSAEKAGAVEVASSTNGQLTPPVMGAAAFLMVEYVGISYLEVIKHAFLPAIISYIALIYIVHLEACKAGIEGLPRRFERTHLQTMLSLVSTLLGIVILTGIVYYGLGWIKTVAGDQTPWVAGLLLLAAYIGLLKYSARFPRLDESHAIEELPDPGPTIKVGLYYLLSVVVLVWCLTVERLSPGLSAFWATMILMIIIMTHRPIESLFRGEHRYRDAWRRGIDDLLSGMVTGARNMVGIGVATAAAGIIVGTVTLTGIGQVMTEFVEFISGGNLFLMLLMTSVICLLLGMGLPTTANYIVVASLMAPVIVELGAQHGLIVPLIAVHMFVFYFGILADDTPPVGLAAFAASAISGGDPIRTGLQGFAYDIRTAILPFMFIFNTQLLLIDIGNWLELLIVVASAVTAMLLFAAATRNYMLVRNRIWESMAMLLIAFTLFRPGFWWDMAYPPLLTLPASELMTVAEQAPADGKLRMQVGGETMSGRRVDKTVLLPLGAPGEGAARLAESGIELRKEGEQLVVDFVLFGSPAEQVGIDFDWEINAVFVKAERPAKQWVFIPALMLLTLVISNQRRRRRAVIGAMDS